jgi:ABC-2 type transport system permease protein
MSSWIIAFNLIKRALGTKKGFVLNILLGFLLPAIIVAALLSFVGNGSGDGKVTIAYVDQDQSVYSEFLVQSIADHPSFNLVELSTEEEARYDVIDGEISAAFLIPVHYGSQILNGETPTLTQIRLSISATTFTLEQAMQSAAVNQAKSISAIQALGGDAQEERIQALLEQQLKRQVSTKSTNLIEITDEYLMLAVVGFMLMFLMIVTNQSITTIVEDRRNQTMARVYASPVRSFQIALGYFLGSFILSTIQVLFILSISRYGFQHDYGMSFIEQFIILECFILAALGIASAVGSLVRNADQLSMINNLVMTPTCMIGGCFWPIDFMPDFMQKLANFVPQRWALDAMNQLSSGAGLTEVSLHIGILAAFAVVLLGFGSTVLRPSGVSKK